MKQLIFSILVLGGVFAFISCERHEWEDTDGKKNGTKNLYHQDDHKKDGDDSGDGN